MTICLKKILRGELKNSNWSTNPENVSKIPCWIHFFCLVYAENHGRWLHKNVKVLFFRCCPYWRRHQPSQIQRDCIKSTVTQWVFNDYGFACLSQTGMKSHVRSHAQWHQIEQNLIWFLYHKQFKNNTILIGRGKIHINHGNMEQKFNILAITVFGLNQ